jgi:hypothetical protein
MHPSLLRTTGLALRACVRSAGVVPWLVGWAWVAIAAAQEPLSLRVFGIRLAEEAAVLATCAVVFVLSYSAPNIAVRRSAAARNVSLAMLAAIQYWLLAALIAVVRSQAPSIGLDTPAYIAINTFTTNTYVDSWHVDKRPAWIVASCGQLLLTIGLGMHALDAGWSRSATLASIAVLAAAVVSTHGCRWRRS